MTVLLQRVLTLERLRLYSTAVLGALFVGFILNIFTAKGVLARHQLPLGIDFFGFYAVSRLILEGRGHEVLVLEAQVQAQQRLLDVPVEGYFLPVPYVPVYFLLLVPLAALPYRLAYLLQVALSVGAVVLAVRLLRRESALLSTRCPFWGCSC